MGVDATLAYQLQFGQTLNQRRLYLRALADEHKNLCFTKTFCKGVILLNVVGPYCDVMAFEFLKAFERADGIEIVVQDRDVHSQASPGLGIVRELVEKPGTGFQLALLDKFIRRVCLGNVSRADDDG